jgi:hypothetical protein
VKPLALESEELQGLWLKLLDDDVGNFSTTSSFFFISLAKLGFNSASYRKLVSEMHDVCHSQAKKLSFHQKTVFRKTIFYFTRKKLAS